MSNKNKLGFVFPGQGSQSVGMMTAFAEKYPVVKSTFDEASAVLGYDLFELVQQGPEQELNSTLKTQPALLTASVATWRIWCNKGGVKPHYLAGHSLGEYSALVCAGSLDFKDAVSLVADRGAYMQSAVPAGIGSMAAILGLPDTEVVSICKSTANDQIVTAANFNSPGQVVIAGHTEAIERVITAAKNVGAKRAIMLSVSVPSHCALMEEAAQQLANRMENIEFTLPQIPVIHNINAKVAENPAEIRKALESQLHQPVRWTESMLHMFKSGITQIVECGPGKVLSGLIKRIDKNIELFPVYDPASMDTAFLELSQ